MSAEDRRDLRNAAAGSFAVGVVLVAPAALAVACACLATAGCLAVRSTTSVCAAVIIVMAGAGVVLTATWPAMTWAVLLIPAAYMTVEHRRVCRRRLAGR